jgi:hypothetical protein
MKGCWNGATTGIKRLCALLQVNPIAMVTLNILEDYKPAIRSIPLEIRTLRMIELTDWKYPIREVNNLCTREIEYDEDIEEQGLKKLRGADVRETPLRSKIRRVRESTVFQWAESILGNEFINWYVKQMRGFSVVTRQNLLILCTAGLGISSRSWLERINVKYCTESSLLKKLGTLSDLSKKYAPLLTRYFKSNVSAFRDSKKGVPGYILREKEFDYSVVEDALKLISEHPFSGIDGKRINIEPYINQMFDRADWTAQRIDFTEFISNTINWTRSGSSDRGRAEVDGKSYRMNKTALPIFMDASEIIESLDFSEQSNTPIFKLDHAGKGRVIYSANAELFLLATYIFTVFPKLVSTIPGSPFKNSEIEKAQSRYNWMQYATKGRVLSPVDYSGFDHHVSNEDLIIWYKTLIRYAKKRWLGPFPLWIEEAIIKLINNPTMRIPNTADNKRLLAAYNTSYEESEKWLKVKMAFGLASGRPETAIAGTMIQAAWDSYFSNVVSIGVHTPVRLAEWQGDDLNAMFKSFFAAQSWVEVAKTCKADLNPTKFYIESGKYSNTDFLRYHITPEFASSPAANLIASISERNPLSITEFTWQDKIRESATTMLDAAWRGFDYMNELLTSEIKAIVNAFSLPKKLSFVPINLGGTSIDRTNSEVRPRPPIFPKNHTMYGNEKSSPMRQTVISNIGEDWSESTIVNIEKDLYLNAKQGIHDSRSSAERAMQYEKELKEWLKICKVVELPKLKPKLTKQMNKVLTNDTFVSRICNSIPNDLTVQACRLEGKNWRQRFTLLAQRTGKNTASMYLNKMPGKLLWELVTGQATTPIFNGPSVLKAEADRLWWKGVSRIVQMSRLDYSTYYSLVNTYNNRITIDEKLVAATSRQRFTSTTPDLKGVVW